MRRHIEKLKQQPEEHRQTLALGVALLFTALVALVWFSTLGARFAALEVQRVTATANEAKEALSQLKARAGVGDVPQQLNEVQQLLDRLQAGGGPDAVSGAASGQTRTP